jgi:thiamine-phosphate pyrophosphorylase
MTSYETRLMALRQLAEDIAQDGPGARLPRLFLFTDPERTPEPEAIAAHMPEGSGVVYRHFGASDRLHRARTLRAIARDRGLTLLIGNDLKLADVMGADGLHLSQTELPHVPAFRATHPDWLITAACHDLQALTNAQTAGGLDALFVSPVFPSRSPSAQDVSVLGVPGFRAMASMTPLPVLALGGVTATTAPRLKGSGAYGFAAVEAFRHTSDEERV